MIGAASMIGHYPDFSDMLAGFPRGMRVSYVDVPTERGTVIEPPPEINAARIESARRRGEVWVRWDDGDIERNHVGALRFLSALEQLAEAADD